MPKSSRHKSHKHGKHSSKEVKEYSESDEDIKTRDIICKEGSKRKDHPSQSNGVVVEEHTGSKRRKEKEKGDVSAVSDRWSGGGAVESGTKVESDKKLKTKSVGEKKDESNKGVSRVESKRKHEKEFVQKEFQLAKDYKVSKDKVKLVEKEKEEREKERERERKVKKESVQEVEDEVVDIGDAIMLPTVVFGEEKEGKLGRGNNVWPVHEERVHESEKEIEKRRKKREVFFEKDKYQNDVKGGDDKYISSRGERVKDGKYKDEKHKDVAYGDKHLEDVSREARCKDEKYADDIDRERRYRDAKYRESSDKVNKNNDDKYREDVDSDKRPRDDKYREDGDRDMKYRDAKYRDDGDRDTKYRDVKYYEDGDRDTKYRDAKYRDDGDKDKKYRDVKYHEDGDRDTKYRDVKYHEDGDRDTKYRDAKYREDVDKDYRRRVDKYHDDRDRDDKQRENWYYEDYRRNSTIREEMQRDDMVKDKRLREDGTNNHFDPKRSSDGTEVAEFRHKRLSNRDGSPNFDDRGTRYKDDRGKRRASDKQEHDDARYRSNKEHYIDVEKKSTSVRVELIGNRGRSNLRDAGMVISPNNTRRGDSLSYRLKQEEPRYQDYIQEVREKRDATPNKEYTCVSVVTENAILNEKSLPKDDNQGDDVSTDRHLTEDVQTSPVRMVDKSPSTASNDRRNLRKTEIRRSLDVQHACGRDNKVNRELPESISRDEISQPEIGNFSSASPFTRPNNFNNNNRSLSQTSFRGGPDRPFDDDNNRNKQNRRRRMDSNMGRSSQGNNWRGVPNWPSQGANGFVPFQHGPPPLGFHPVMPQFSSPPMFNVRPSMEMNQSGVPFRHNPMFGDDPHTYGRLDWDHSRGLTRGWENSRDIWKVQNPSVSAEISAVAPKDDILQPGVEVESVEIGDISDVVERKTAESLKAIAEDMIESKIRDDAYYSRAYLSMLDISEDLSLYELYSQYSNLVGMDQIEDSVEDDPRLLIMEEDIDALSKDSKKIPNGSLFSTMNDFIFQSAITMYKKIQKEAMTMGQTKVPSPIPENTESALPSVSNDEESPVEIIPTTRQKEIEIAVSDSSKVKIEGDPLINAGVNPEPVRHLKEVKMETEDDNIEDISLSLKEAIMDSTNDKGNKGHKLIDGKYVPVPFSGTSAEALSEGVNESGSVNLSRIQSPESTH